MTEHAVPSPVYPLLHAHENVPAHSYMLHLHDSCALQLNTHLCLSMQLSTVACTRECASMLHEHSSMSEHAVPSPVYPLLHAHENVPALFVHAALADSCALQLNTHLCLSMQFRLLCIHCCMHTRMCQHYSYMLHLHDSCALQLNTHLCLSMQFRLLCIHCCMHTRMCQHCSYSICMTVVHSN